MCFFLLKIEPTLLYMHGTIIKKTVCISITIKSFTFDTGRRDWMLVETKKKIQHQSKILFPVHQKIIIAF